MTSASGAAVYRKIVAAFDGSRLSFDGGVMLLALGDWHGIPAHADKLNQQCRGQQSEEAQRLGLFGSPSYAFRAK